MPILSPLAGQVCSIGNAGQLDMPIHELAGGNHWQSLALIAMYHTLI
jgi:hypothetical protein